MDVAPANPVRSERKHRSRMFTGQPVFRWISQTHHYITEAPRPECKGNQATGTRFWLPTENRCLADDE